MAHKQLALVDLPDRGSHQHEIGSGKALREFFTTDEATRGSMTWVRFSDGSDPERETGEFTFYDTRAKSAARTGRPPEWRLYYTGGTLDDAEVGDLLVFARSVEGHVYALLFAAGSGWERAARLLFRVDTDDTQLRLVYADDLDSIQLDLARQTILDQLDIDYALAGPDDLTDLVIGRFGFSFPRTSEMGALARELAMPTDDTADALLAAWIDMEERLFRALEAVIVGDRLDRGFESVDDFVGYSLSVHNRRKSRMGHALEHHLAALFERSDLRFSRQVRTEGNRTADFVFPGATEYRDPSFAAERLVVLAAKSSCKDRWPQVLADADRVATKHLGTLDMTLTGQQLADMSSRSVVPVMPEVIRGGYSGVPGEAAIMSVAEFIERVSTLQS